MKARNRKRQWCACGCPCTATADLTARDGLCPNCLVGAHRPGEQVLAHLRDGLEEWARLLRPTGAYVTEQQTDQAADAWAIWHQSAPCPVPR